MRTLSILRPVLLLLLLVTSPAYANQTNQQFVLDSLNKILIPGFERFHASTQELQQQLSSFCIPELNGAERRSLTEVQEQFRITLQSWQQIQHWRQGPMELSNRHQIIQFWPDKKGRVSRQLDGLLQQLSQQQNLAVNLEAQSVTVRGLPALEVLLFEPDYTSGMKPEQPPCLVAQAITEEVASIAAASYEEWQGSILSAYGEMPVAQFRPEIAVKFIQPMMEQLEVITNLKIRRPLGESPERARAVRLESPRSGESLNNMLSNLEALGSVYQLTLTLLPQAKHEELGYLWQQMLNNARAIRGPLNISLETADTWQRMDTLANHLQSVHQQLESALADQGYYMGFNSQDGD